MSRARPDVLAAGRFALFAERLRPLLEDAETVMGTDFDKDMTAMQRGRLGKAKLQAREHIDSLRAALFPED